MERRLTGNRQIGEDVAMLLLKCGYHGHHGFDKARPLGTLRAKAAFAPEHAGPNGPLRRIVCRFHPDMAHERPQGLPPLEDVPTRPFRLRHATGVSRFEWMYA